MHTSLDVQVLYYTNSIQLIKCSKIEIFRCYNLISIIIQCNAVMMRAISSISSQYTPKQSYGVSFVILMLYLCYAIVIVVLNVTSWQIWPHYNTTWPYLIWYVGTPFLVGECEALSSCLDGYWLGHWVMNCIGCVWLPASTSIDLLVQWPLFTKWMENLPYTSSMKISEAWDSGSKFLITRKCDRCIGSTAAMIWKVITPNLTSSRFMRFYYKVPSHLMSNDT